VREASARALRRRRAGVRRRTSDPAEHIAQVAHATVAEHDPIGPGRADEGVLEVAQPGQRRAHRVRRVRIEGVVLGPVGL
jgi:hypothetical protein